MYAIRSYYVLDGDAVAQRILTGAAVFLWHQHAEQTQLAHLGDQVDRQLVRQVALP